MSEKSIITQKLFHLSINDSLEKLTPRIPFKVWPEHEDNHIERVCFSDTINGCLRALFPDDGDEYTIYVPANKIKIYFPTSLEVIDQEITNEVWAIDEVPVIKVGSLIVTGYDKKSADTIESQELIIPKVNFFWSQKNFIR